MKAEIKPRFYNERERLEEKIPLNTPFALYIEPSDKCNFRCKFCPTSDLKLMTNTQGRNYGNMDFNLYKKIIDDASQFNDNIKLLQLYESGEPLLNPMFPEMIEYAKKSGKFNKIQTTTNAYLLNHNLSLKIIDAGLNRINISIEGVNEEQYLNISNVKIDFNKLVNNIKFFYDNKKQCEVSIKIVGNYLSDNDKNKFYNIFGNICDIMFIESITPYWSGFDISHLKITTNKDIFGKQFKKISVCPQIFYAICINSNGSVSPCANDWARKVIIGDANREKLKDIWNGNKLLHLQKLFLRGERNNHPFCSSCLSPEYCLHDNIDDYAEEILLKIERQDRTGQDRTGQDRTPVIFEYAYLKTA